MTSKPPLLALLAWQTALLVNIGAPADPEHLRYARAVLLPPGSDIHGAACAVLDAAVFAHAASAGASDLRLYRGYPGSPLQAEVPYLLTESGPEPVDAVTIHPTGVTRRGGELRFDLRMPPRAYSELRLRLDPGALAGDFVGTVLVSAGDPATGKHPPKPLSLGNFGIFDLRREGLGRWTTLLLAESTAPVLHLALSLRTPAGQPIAVFPSTLVENVAVPPSRERQTAYTPVATTASFSHQGGATVATLQVPAHVPVEELHIALNPSPHSGPHPSFAHDVVLTARSDDDPFNEPETLDAGLLQDMHLASGDPRLNPIDVQETDFPSTLGATLASAATVSVAIANGAGAPLPLASATLEMRERRLCFTASPNATYTLRYGDPALTAPFYPDAPQVTAPALTATLGPQTRNPHWTPRRDTRPFFDRHPELFWVIVLACTGMMGGTALQFVQYRAEGTQS